jgi:hypothetical protein
VRYRAYDLVIESELAIPGAQPLGKFQAHDPDLREPDLRIALENLAAGAPARSDGPYTLMEDGSLVFAMPGLARYRVEAAARTLAVEIADDAHMEAVCAMLVATALPCWLWMRGDVVLHAAAAVPQGEAKAVALAGPSGAGKSTMLQELLARGADVVADDTLRLWWHDGEIRASGLPGAMQMRIAEAAAVEEQTRLPLGKDKQTRIIDTFGSNKESGSEKQESRLLARQWAAVPVERQRQSAMLGSIMILSGEAPARDQPKRLLVGAEPKRLVGAAALVALRRNLHRATAARLLGLEPGMLPRLASILRTVAVYAGPV